MPIKHSINKHTKYSRKGLLVLFYKKHFIVVAVLCTNTMYLQQHKSIYRLFPEKNH